MQNIKSQVVAFKIFRVQNYNKFKIKYIYLTIKSLDQIFKSIKKNCI